MNPPSDNQNKIFKNPFDNHKFNSLFDALYTPLCRYSLKYVTNKDAAEDIVQDLFVYIWENRERLATISSIESYAYTAIKNRSLSYLQKNFTTGKISGYNQATETGFISELPGPEELLDSKELEAILEQALEALPLQCRTIFTMKRFGEFSNEEVAEKLHISVKTVENQMTIALRKLAGFVSTHWGLVFFLLFDLLNRIL